MGWPADIEKRVRDWCKAVDEATSSSTQGLQARPENQWDVHPLVDGCLPDDGENGAGRPPVVR